MAEPLTRAGQALRSELDRIDSEDNVRFGTWDNAIIAIEDEVRDAARREQDELRAAADPYTSFAEHRRQEDAGTHLFDPQCPFCFFLHFDSEERAELAADAGKGLDRE